MGTWFIFQLTPLALPQAIAAGLCFMAAGFIWPLRRESASAAWLLVVLGGAILWSLAGALEFSAATLPGKIFWTQVSYIGIVAGPAALFHFTYAHTQGGARPHRAVSALIALVGLAILASVFTNAWHGLQWPGVTAVRRGDLLFALYERGPMFWATVVYCYGFMFASSAMLAAHTISLGSVFRRQAWTIILATLAPWFTSLIYVMRLGPRPELDHTPVGFALTGLLLSWAVISTRLFELIPVAANTLLLHIPDPVLVTDPAGRLVRANAAALRRLPSLEHHIGDPLVSGLRRDPELAAAIARGATLSGPHTVACGDTWWTIESSSLDEAKGRPRGRLVVLRDITSQKRSELALLHAKQALEHTLARADALASEAVAANAAKSTFLAQVSHDLRTPLHAILGMTEVLRAEPLEPAQQTQVATIADAGDALLRLINDLLNLSRIEAGSIDLAREPFQLEQVLAQVEDLVGPVARRKGLSFSLAPGFSARLRGDPDRLRQILVNLVGNAVKFTDRGGVSLRASAAGPLLRIDVADTGVGIAPAYLADIFTPFNRGDPELARRVEGTGLGLAITRRLTEAMRGTVSAASRPGDGTTFSLELPIVDETPAVPAAESAPVPAVPPPPAPLRRVLLADDHPLSLRVSSAQLSRCNCAVDTVTGGFAALARLAQEPYDLIVLDGQMPDLNGWEVAARLRAAPADSPNARTPIVALTADLTPESHARWLAAGVAVVIGKPVRTQDLAATLEELHPRP